MDISELKQALQVLDIVFFESRQIFSRDIEESFVVVLVPINDHRRKNTYIVHGIRSLIGGKLVEILRIFSSLTSLSDPLTW